ncbi:CaiB/BaiF CoA transferase family protein [Roseomonas marmotae]|uniref:CoA transferase n=1 Tax=Roseomonas marmotae TaxID=2768161 RepID=A0ABS3KHB7_9PROT|nr:CoA transferase [Roseomonas marmotae]MBO1076854.1 CoA transferase [Roseomonas marmotae]QTI81190.1 CoA transferase [Roseomonas marmotae]
MSGPLPRIRVLDMTRIFAGPWAAQILADFGAEVVKVEHPRGGDDVRRMGFPQKDAEGQETGDTSSFLAMNRGKRSVALDIATPEGQAALRALASKADVFIENFKAGGLARYGLDYASLSALNPRLVYCSITGFGQDGPYAALPGYDPIFQAMSGLLSVTGNPDGTPGAGPALVGYSVSDINAGFYATIAILAALHHRDTISGQGQHIDLALLDSQVASHSHIAMNYLVSGKMPVRAGTASQINTPWQSFDTADRPLMVAVGNDRQFAQFCAVLGLPDVPADPRFATNRQRMAHKPELLPLLQGALLQRTAGEWVALLNEAGISSGPLNDFGAALEDPQLRHRGMWGEMPHPRAGTMPFVANPVRFSGTPVVYDRAPPQLGEHTEEVLAEWLGTESATQP